MIRLLSIDQAFLHSGFAFFEDEEYITHGSYKVTKDDSKQVKYDKFIDDFKEKVDDLKPTIVVTEYPWMGPNAMVFGLISELVGIMRCYCHLNNIEFEVVHIGTYRSKLGVKNKKAAVTEYITKSFPELEFKNDDESDSMALGLGYIEMLKERGHTFE